MSDIVCPACSAVNRVPDEKPAAAAKCGKCQAALFDGHPVAVDARAFGKHLSRNSIPVVVDFWAEWCGPCKMMAPEFQKAAQALEPAVRFAKLDTEAAQAEAAAHGIRSIPTMILFRNGREVARQSGAMPAGQIVQWVREVMRG
ncbi:thioredoxin TrxC [Aestuariivirga sp.]|uniref:thioredoxin TrxC n=1 Tax=Aestuariivirga sp. TaxID=2650926 RepID=UPI0035931528